MTSTQTDPHSAGRIAPWQRLANLKLRHKLAAVMALVVVAMGALSALSFLDIRSSALEDRELMTRRLSEVAQSLVVHYEALAKSGQMPTEAAQQAALTAISALRFGKEDYFFVLSSDGKLIANAFNAKNVGKPVSIISAK